MLIDTNSLYPVNDLSIYRGAVLRPISEHQAEFIKDAIIVYASKGDLEGKILGIGDAQQIAYQFSLNLTDLKINPGLLMPAFFDTHFHWVQDDVREMPKVSLIEWLERYTFPEEAKYFDVEFARTKARSFWERILSVGTIGGFCYSSIHETALAEAISHAPEDFYIGNVLMTMNCPDYLKQTEAEAKLSVNYCSELYKNRYVCTPRFAPTTSPYVMLEAAQAAERHNCFLQTHLSETQNEIKWVIDIYKELTGFEDVQTYTDIYKRVNMLGPKTILGHCIHLEEREWKLLSDSQSKIASCPTSNAPVDQLGIGSGLFDFQKAEAMNIHWSLASDIGGGPFLSMFDVMKSFVEQNREIGVFNANYTKALYRCTFMGADAMGLSSNRGMLKDGFYFDAIRVPLPKNISNLKDSEEVLESLITSLPSRASADNLVLETIIKGKTRFKNNRK